MIKSNQLQIKRKILYVEKNNIIENFVYANINIIRKMLFITL
jgi:hypothetical protein